MKTNLVVLLFATSSFPVYAESSTDSGATVDPIISEGTPAEVMKTDAVVTPLQGKTDPANSTGNVIEELQNDLPFHFNTNLKPGNYAGVQGTGKGSEETDVNVLGIPLNGAQGGGADLSIFPSYFWSSYNYQIGPSLGAYDPRSVSGSLTLRLWTQDKIGQDSEQETALYSSRRVEEFSFGKSGKTYAVMGGYTTDAAQGPGLTLSAIPYENGPTKITVHLIAVDLKVFGFASQHSGTTDATQETVRLIPVVQVDEKLPENSGVIKASLFHDYTLIDYKDPSDNSNSIARVHQTGLESAWVKDQTRVGLSLRDVAYERNGLPTIPQEQAINLQATHGFIFHSETFGKVLFEPTLAGNAVTRKGFYPYGSLGLRADQKFLGGDLGEFIRAGNHDRFPSLIDRYYGGVFPFGNSGTSGIVLPNPGLRPETVRSVEAGTEYKKDSLRTQFTAFYRQYWNARYTESGAAGPFPIVASFQIVNQGRAYTYGAIHSLDFEALPILDIGTREAYENSRIYDLSLPFPYSPRWVSILKFDLHTLNNQYGLEIDNKAASNFLAFSETSGRPVPGSGYYYLNLLARVRLMPELTARLGVEDVFNRIIQYQIGSPDIGRVYTVSLMGTF